MNDAAPPENQQVPKPGADDAASPPEPAPKKLERSVYDEVADTRVRVERLERLVAPPADPLVEEEADDEADDEEDAAEPPRKPSFWDALKDPIP
jgi:hypothetical protein